VADRLADHQAAGVFQGLADAFAAGHFAHAGVAALSLRMTMLRVK
jgi:aspartyl-tRNA synthetase